MTLRQQTVQGVFWSAIQSWGSTLISALVLLVLLRLLDRSAFGLLAMASACVAIAETILRQGLGVALIQRSEVKPGHLDTAFVVSVVTGVGLTVVGIGSAGLVSDMLGEPRLAPILRWLSLSFLVGGLSNTQQAILMRTLAFKALAVRSLAGLLAGGVVGIGMALLGCGVWSLVGQTLTTVGVGAVVLWVASGWRPGLNASMTHFRELFTFSVNVMSIDILTIVNMRAVDLLIGFFLGAERLAYFAVAYQVFAMLIRVLTQTVSAVALPSFSRLQHDARRMRNAYLSATEMSCLVGLPAFLGMAAVAPELVYGVIGNQWEGSIPLIQVLALLGALHSALHFNVIILMASGRSGWLVKLTLFDVLVNIGAIVIAAQWGVFAVAVAFTARAYVFGPISLWMAGSILNLASVEVLRRVSAPLWASLAMFVGVFVGRRVSANVLAPSSSLALSVALGMVIYALAIVIIAPALVRKAGDLLRVAVSSAKRENAR